MEGRFSSIMKNSMCNNATLEDKYALLKKRYIGIDLLRIISAFFVCMFHTKNQLNCDYGLFNSFSTMGAVFMTLFFMLSGFSLFVNHSSSNLSDYCSVKIFWKKRVLSLLPMYFFVAVIYEIVHVIMGMYSIDRVLLLFPIETLGTQSVFSSLFGYSHNGGTWFISCILICYFLYPFLQEIVKNTTRKTHIILLCLCAFLLLYSPIVTYYLDNVSDIYSNPFFRALEFLIGVILASMKLDYASSKIVNKIIYSWLAVSITFIIMIFAITIAVDKGFAVGNYMLYNWICLPCFSLILLGISGVSNKSLEKSKLINYLSGLAYVFFLAQLFSNKICKFIIQLFDIKSNFMKILLGWGICIVIAIVFGLIDIAIKKMVRLHQKSKKEV